MALSATFTANFASFYDAVDKADAKLKSFGDGADKVGGRLNTLANQFSGQKIVQEATIMAKAVEEIGGVSKLTEKELARLGATTNEAVTKMKLLGMDVPKGLQDIADKTKDANKATTDWMGTFTKIAGVVGVAFGVDAIKGFIGSVFDAAGAIKDLSDQWGVSTKFAQQWSAAAKLSGIETEQLGKSIQYVTEKLSESSPEYDALLKNIGLSSELLRRMPGEEAYKEIIKAIASVTDETKQYDIALGILGPSAKKVIGGIRDGMYDAADAQKYMSDETIKRLEAAGDAWERFKNNVIIYSGEMLASTMQVTGTMTQSWSTFFHTMALTAKDALTGGSSAAAFLQMKTSLDDYQASLKTTSKEIQKVGETEKEHAGGMKSTAEVLAELRAKEEAAKKAQDDRKKTIEATKKAEEDYAKAAQKHVDVIDDLLAQFTGQDLIGKANDYFAALLRAGPIEEMTAEQQATINKVMEDAIAVYAAAGKEAPQYMYDIWAATVKASESTETYAEQLQALAAAQAAAFTGGLGGGAFDPTKIGQSVALGVPKAFEGVVKDPSIFEGVGEGIASALSSSILKAIEGGGNLFQAAGSAIGSYLLDPKQSGVGKAVEGAAKKLPGLLGGAISGAIPVVGSLIGPAIGWLSDKISGWFGKKEYEKLRDGFIQSAGGIAELTKAAQAAGISLDALFRAKKTDQVQAAIKTIQDALASEDLRKAFVATQGGFDALTHAAETAGITVDDLFAAKSTDAVQKSIQQIEDALKFQADAYQLAIDTAEKYGFTLEELGPAMQRQELDKQAQQLYKDWEVLNSAGLDTVLITEKMSTAVSEYVQRATKMGTEVPDAMRPMLEAMVKSGTLLDANGDAITDLEDAGISFSLSMSDGFKQLIDQVGKLTDAISRSLGLAIKEIPQPKIKGEVTWDVHPIATPSQSSGGEELESYQGGTEGFRNFGKGTPVMLHGWEAVVPREESGAFATVSAGGAATAAAAGPSIVINAQGAFFDTPGDLQRLADRVNEALTAKFGLRNAMRAG
jgi:hypothetical protein